MSIILFIFSFIFGFFGGLAGNTATGVQNSAYDAEAKADINVVSLQLELYYNETSTYPTEAAFDSQGPALFPDINLEALSDPQGFNFNATGSSYDYAPTQCSETSCQKYTVTAQLTDGTTYTKESLN